MTDTPRPDEAERQAADELSRLGQEMGLDEQCTCTPLPDAEGPCAWCDIHGQPSVAWRQGSDEGRHNERVIAEMELKDAAKAYNHTAAALLRERDRYRRSASDAAVELGVALAELTEARAFHQETWTRSRERGFELDRLKRENGRLTRVLRRLVAAIEDDHADDMTPLWAEARALLGGA